MSDRGTPREVIGTIGSSGHLIRLDRTPCPKCRGTGDVHGIRCHRCGGTGDLPKRSTMPEPTETRTEAFAILQLEVRRVPGDAVSVAEEDAVAAGFEAAEEALKTHLASGRFVVAATYD